MLDERGVLGVAFVAPPSSALFYVLQCFAGAGDDYVFDTSGSFDTIAGEDGNDTLSVHRSNSSADFGEVTIDGGTGGDTITAGGGFGPQPMNFRMLGGEGNDYLVIQSAQYMQLDAGPGDDYVTLEGRFGNLSITLGPADTDGLGADTDGLGVAAAPAQPASAKTTVRTPISLRECMLSTSTTADM